MNIRLNDTHVLRWITSDPATGAAANVSAQTVSVYEEGTDTAIVTPAATNVATGHYRASIVATTANGFEAGKVYNVGVDATVGGVACKGIIATFKVDSRQMDELAIPGDAMTLTPAERLAVQALVLNDATPFPGANIDGAISGISVVAGGAAISKLADSFSLTTGSVVSGTIADTFGVDSVYHQLADAGGTLDCYYEFQIGAGRVPITGGIIGYVNGGNDDPGLYAWRWDNSSWVQITTLVGQTGSTIREFSGRLFKSMVGTGADAGKVRLRIYSNALTSASIYVDQIAVGYATDISEIVYTGQIVGAGTKYVDLSAEASALDDFYFPGLLTINGAQPRRIESYVGGVTKRINVATDWAVTPSSGDEVVLWPWASVRMSAADPGIIDATVAPALASLDAAVSSRAVAGDAMTLTAAYEDAKTAAQAGDAMGITAGAVDTIIDEVVEGSLTLRQVVRIMLSALAGKADGGGSTTIHFRDMADTKNRVTATVDVNGNRTAVSRDGT